ncbi:MAG: AsnC family transcriptional regulator [Planctomycetes bacterium]|nr:AsnC family transcriptional regulator [Planctomycetota bacterium]
MDNTDKQILTAIQADLPVEVRPFDVLAERLKLDAADVVARVKRMAAEGLLRRVGPVFDSRGLGYVSTLAAARVPPERLRQVADRVSRMPGVTHNYERRHAYNLWFTLTCASRQEEERVLEALRRDTGIPHIFSLPALAVYKIRVKFDLMGDSPAADAETAPPAAHTETAPPAAHAETAPPASQKRCQEPYDFKVPDTFSDSAGPTQRPLSGEQKELVRLLQDGLPILHEPFVGAGAQLGWPVERIVEQIRQWMGMGIVRRFGAVVRHRDLGFAANGMAVFRSGGAQADEAGRRLAARPEVSHCYRRPPLEDFPFNLYAMVHGRSEDAVRQAVAAMAAEAGLTDYDVLFSVTEFKKASMRYFVE